MNFTERNVLICQQYNAGETLGAIARVHGISKQRVRQIVIAGGYWRRAIPRDAFLGVDVTPETKAKLQEVADQKQTSMSKLASDAIEDMLDDVV